MKSSVCVRPWNEPVTHSPTSVPTESANKTMRSILHGIKKIVWKLHPWFTNPRQSWLKFLQFQNKYFNNLAINAMVWRGFSRQPIHPKHLFSEERGSRIRPLLKPDIRFLDIGSGSGSDCIEAAKRGAVESVGIEYNPESIQLARERAGEQRVIIDIRQLDLERASLPFESGHFDLINFSNVLEHLHNRVAVLKELKRIKKDHAPIVISIPNTNTTWKKRLRRAGVDSRDDRDHKIEYSEESLRAELAEAGLRITSELYPIVPSFPWHGLIASSAILSPALFRRLQRWKHDFADRHPDESIGWTFHAE